jgi:hypothetical protein
MLEDWWVEGTGLFLDYWHTYTQGLGSMLSDVIYDSNWVHIHYVACGQFGSVLWSTNHHFFKYCSIYPAMEISRLVENMDP